MPNYELLGAAYSLGAALCWALSVNLFKSSAAVVPPLALNLFKSSLALLLFVPVIAVDDLTLTTQELSLLLLSGVVGISAADTLFFWGMRRISASQLALVDCFYAPFVVLLAFFFLDETLETGDIAGGSLILGGLLLTVWRSPNKGGAKNTGSGSNRDSTTAGLLVAGIAVALMGLSIVMVKGVVEARPVALTTAVRLLGACAGIVFLAGSKHVASFFSPVKAPSLWGDMAALLRPQRLWRSLLPASILGNCVALYLWIGGYKYTSAHTAALLNQMSTIFILIIAVLFFGEKPTRRALWAVALAFGGCIAVLL